MQPPIVLRHFASLAFFAVLVLHGLLTASLLATSIHRHPWYAAELLGRILWFPADIVHHLFKVRSHGGPPYFIFIAALEELLCALVWAGIIAYAIHLLAPRRLASHTTGLTKR